MKRKEKKKIKLLNQIVPEIFKNISEGIEDKIKDVCEDIFVDAEVKKNEEKEKFGYQISDLRKYADLIKFKKSKQKITKKFADVIISDNKTAIITYDSLQNELYIIAKLPALELYNLNIIWIGSYLTDFRKSDKNNVYYITSNKCRLIFDRNTDEILEFETF